MPTTYAIPNGRTVMDATTYSGTGASASILNTDNGTVGFKPDFVWLKCRSNATNHYLTDSVRGTNQQVYSNSAASEGTSGNIVTALNSNGFSLGTDAEINGSGRTYVAWQWQAGQGTTSSNTNGSITSTVSVNATAGFSVVSYTLNNSTFTVGHGLSAAPSMIMVKDRDTANNWDVYHISIGAGYRIQLNSSAGPDATTQVWNNTTPTATVFSGNSAWWSNPSTSKMIAYCWTPIPGFSAFGSFTGNGSTDGPFVYTGFRPRFILSKSTSSPRFWFLTDTARDTYNVANLPLFPNDSQGETAGTTDFDILSNGFKARTTNAAVNGNGETIIYAAFAENPFKYANAR